ncbi:peptidoglycan-binding protein [Solwaraspora sp. WMMD1047]|uniref:peptidoglycan-binding protein n=1 Tax=Solwaraspora sp. WMMD1047 TaxID=3016102 RepID=UPI002417C16A|nr:peptidoglycan-binding protein [Solwaraspora sp. WMMD1047]MDG4834037.1 peptidoglycan-binding protein [Solwaraspora sp. WMMD1047]
MTGTAQTDGGARRRRPRARTAVAVLAAVVVVAAGVAAAVGFGGGSESTASGSTLPPATATITRQTLVDRETHNGELGYGATRAAASRAGGTVTWLPATGTTVKRGQALYRVDEEPVVLLHGSLPAYRMLEPGMDGRDVKQFEQNLAALGNDGFTVDSDYTSATADAVRDWQEKLGLPETGRVEPGRIVYAAGAVRVDSHDAAIGDTVQPGSAVVTFTGTARVITVELDIDDQRLARRDAPVTINLPDGTATTGKITMVETVIETSAGGGGQEASTETKIEVTVTGDDPAPLADYDQASVEVGFTADERADVLSVPVAALLAVAEGGYGLEVVEGEQTRIVAVETGLFAAGQVEVSGPDIAEGLAVGVPND